MLRDAIKRLRQVGRWTVLAGGLLAVTAGFATLGTSRMAAADLPSTETPKTAGNDLLGDPLPEHALVRLGTLRWRHGDTVSYVIFSQDGKTVVSGGADNTIRVWERESGKELRRIKGGGVLAISSDCKRAAFVDPLAALAAPGNANSLHLYDLQTGKEIRAIPLAGQFAGQSVTGLTFSPDGKLLAGRGMDRIIHLWNAETGKEVRQLKPAVNNNIQGFVGVNFGGHEGPGMVFAPDGKTLAATDVNIDNRAGIKTSIVVWNLETGKESTRIPLTQVMTATLAFSPDGKSLAYNDGGQIVIAEAATGKQSRKIEGDKFVVSSLLFAADGKTLFSKGMMDSSVQQWDLETGKSVRQFGAAPQPQGGNVLGFGGMVGLGGIGMGCTAQELALAPDGKTLATVGHSNAITLWDVATGNDVTPGGGHRGSMDALALSADGKTAISHGGDRTLRLWDAMTGKERQQFPLTDPMAHVALSPDGSILAVASVNKTQLLDTTTGKELRTVAAHQNGTASVVFSADGKLLASRGLADSTIRVSDVATGNEVKTITLQQPNPNPKGGVRPVVGGGFGGFNGFATSWALAFSPDGKLLASPGMNNSLLVWDLATGKELRTITLGQQQVIQSLAFSPDGRCLAALNLDATVGLYELAGGKERAHLGKPYTPPNAGNNPLMIKGGGMVVNIGGLGMMSSTPALTFAPDGRTLAVAHPDLTIRLWDIPTAKERVQLKGHQGTVQTLAYAADGKKLLSGSSDTTGLIWDVATLGTETKTPPVELEARKVEFLWNDLAGDNAVKAYQAIGALAASSKQSVPWLQAHLKPVAPIDLKQVEKWIADLDNDDFAVRQKASQELQKAGELALYSLTRALENKPPLETRKRIEDLLDGLTGKNLTTEQLRLVRAVEVLEEASTPEARQVLEMLAKGAPGALPTREAQGALERLTKKR